MKIIALGANLPSSYGTPAQTLKAAAQAISEKGIKVIAASNIWKTAPVPFDPDQPWYHNAVMAVDTDLAAHDLLKTLLAIEQDFGRVRTVKNAPRLLDLDLISYDDEIILDGPELLVPHPRMHERAFVLMPMTDIAKEWLHPQTGARVDEMLSHVPENQKAERTEDQIL